uniref:Sulfotransferase domain-containing protein n=1 Tax=Pseudictyota dubia TaxID=2749911 RepID=A0A7R9WEY8_9STRA
MRNELSQPQPKSPPDTGGGWLELLGDIYSGVTVGASHSMWFVTNWVRTDVIQPTLRLVWKRDSSEGSDTGTADPGLKVIGVGYGRTGTYSLTLALEELGFPCLHTQHLYENPEIFQMWTEEVFSPSLESNHATLGEPDFDLMASQGWRATMDLPMALYYEHVLAKFPDCKFILTTRDNSEVWFRSWNMLTKTITQPTQHFRFMSGIRNLDNYLRWLFSIVNRDDMYLTAPHPFPEQIKENAIASYETHNTRVREVIPKGQLLEYNVKQGWEPLCEFLDVEHCPTTPFPKTNSATSVQVQAVAAMVVPLTVAVFLVFYLFSYLFQHSTGQTVLQWLNIKRRGLLVMLSGKGVQKRERLVTDTKKSM